MQKHTGRAGMWVRFISSFFFCSQPRFPHLLSPRYISIVVKSCGPVTKIVLYIWWTLCLCCSNPTSPRCSCSCVSCVCLCVWLRLSVYERQVWTGLGAGRGAEFPKAKHSHYKKASCTSRGRNCSKFPSVCWSMMTNADVWYIVCECDGWVHTWVSMYSPITLANISSINLVSIFRCSSSPRNPVYERSVDFSELAFSFSSYRHSYLGLVFSSRFLDS